MTSRAEHVMQDLREIQGELQHVMDTGLLGPMNRQHLGRIRGRLRNLTAYLDQQDGSVTEELAELIDNLQAIPGLAPPYDTIGQSADAIVQFIADQVDGRAAGIEHWVREKLNAREAERTAAEMRQRVETILQEVATEHLYPALREAGMADPETRVQLTMNCDPVRDA